MPTSWKAIAHGQSLCRLLGMLEAAKNTGRPQGTKSWKERHKGLATTQHRTGRCRQQWPAPRGTPPCRCTCRTPPGPRWACAARRPRRTATSAPHGAAAASANTLVYRLCPTYPALIFLCINCIVTAAKQSQTAQPALATFASPLVERHDIQDKKLACHLVHHSPGGRLHQRAPWLACP